ncbi:MAG TPA: TonB family protein [Candidatus Acidoferrum sp.]|nr:TonB family protein [Candidatus Acidoferrum sp.]
MSDAVIFTDSSMPPEGRRTKVRQPLGALAYLDIVPDNGGIILNLSEDGLAFQAVAPLHDQKQVQLVIQLPHSEIRLETIAEIVWLASSSRQAGVRFVNMPADACLRIREWIESQSPSPADAPSPIGLEPPRTATVDEIGSPSPHEDSSSDSRQQKWFSLMSEFEEKFAQQEESSSVPLEEKPENVPESVSPVAHDAPFVPPRPEIAPWPSAQRTMPEAIARPALMPSHETSGLRSTGGKSPRERPFLQQADLDEPGNGSEYVATSEFNKREEARPRSSDTDRASMTNLRPNIPAVESDLTLLRAAVVQSGPQAKGNESKPKGPTRRRESVRDQVALVVVFALFSVLCFGIGTWVGHLPIGEADQEAPANVPTLKQSNVAASGLVAQPNSPTVGVSLRGDAKRDETRIHSARTDRARLRGSVISSMSTEAQSPAQPRAVLETQSPASHLQEMPTPTVFSSDQHANTAHSNGTAELSPVDLSSENSSPQVIDGYVLRPSDRYNPCHLTYRVDPVYPLQAQQQGIEGNVKIHVVIAADGTVQSEKLISGPPQLVPAALDAAKYWRYLPALLNGQPVPTEKDVEIAFHLPSH